MDLPIPLRHGVYLDLKIKFIWRILILFIFIESVMIIFWQAL